MTYKSKLHQYLSRQIRNKTASLLESFAAISIIMRQPAPPLSLIALALVSIALFTLSAQSQTTSDNAKLLEQAQKLSALAHSLRNEGKYDEALPIAQQALDIRERVLGPEDLMVAQSLHELAGIYDSKNDYVKAEPLNVRALAIREQKLGPNHPDVAWSLFNLAWIYLSREEFNRTEDYYRRATAIQEQALGRDSPDVATMLNDWAILYTRKGEYNRAIELDQRVLEIREKALRPDDKSVAKSLNNLAFDYIRAGEFDKAEQLLRRGLPMWEKASGPNHPEVAVALNNLALVYLYKGDYQSAESLERRVIGIWEKALGPNNPQVAITLIGLGVLFEYQGKYAEAEALYRRALQIREAAFGRTQSEVAEVLSHLGKVLQLIGKDRSESEALFQRALSIFETKLGAENHKVAGPLIGLGDLSRDKGDLAAAESFYNRGLAILEKSLGRYHPDVAGTLVKLASLYRAKNETDRAVDALSRAGELREHNIAYNLPLGSERQKLGYLKLFARDIDDALSLQRAAPNMPAAIMLALKTLLRRKGRALDAISDNIRLLRQRSNARDRQLFTELADARSSLVNIALRGPDNKGVVSYQSRLTDVEQKVDKLEAEVSARSAEFTSLWQPVTIEAVQALIPPQTALLEFGVYLDRVPRYGVYVLTGQGQPRWADLGEAAPIDRALNLWRRALRDPDHADVNKIGKLVYSQLILPLHGFLGSTHHLLVSPDGLLSLVPFAALPDEHGKYLIESYSISYLTSGRDLLRLQVPRESREAPMVVANPVFGEPAVVNVSHSNDLKGPAGRSENGYRRLFFGPLPGANGEIRMLQELLPQASFKTGSQATKAALESANAPSILHIATHGFFLDAENSPNANPLLRSGLALAGANESEGDGILTALDALNLDLWGTKLVVLSACDTGVGEVRSGDGVYGLRRALVIAGAETQVMSLWPISDRSTRDLMSGYYKALMAGDGRGEALRKVQLQMLSAKSRTHPYYWSSFIQTGEWANLQGKR
jgi:CHAT domain-containing protein/Tfp pilus assembly protein PilF/cell division protein FtsL